MVLRMTGASWLAAMMRSEREEDQRSDPPVWLLEAAVEPEVVEALERLGAGE